jgi:medium-chain acyl-[acyl-carrier-protein] hydrolase
MIEKKFNIDFFDVDSKSNLKVEAAARFFQTMATSHSATIGAGYNFLSENGMVWFLHRLEMEFVKYPVLDEQIRISTWHRGFKRHKGFREYLMESSKGETYVKGSSVWIFFDLKKNRISKIPDFISQNYEICEDQLFDPGIDDWNVCGRIDAQSYVETDLRYSDFDINGHVNNTIYIGLLENLYYRTLNQNGKNPIKNIKICFSREIDQSKKTVFTGWEKYNNLYQCNVYDHSYVYAYGQIIPAFFESGGF